MKLFYNLCILITAFIFSCNDQKKEEKPPIKIACVGNSITYGYGVANREKNNYPQQLQHILGDGYEVRNFGVSGNTLLKKGDYPYWQSDKYQEALAFAPDVVYIKLGTNDSKAQNRVHLESDFVNDYKALITSFKEKNKNARMVLLLPVPAFTTDSSSIWNPVIKEQVIPLTKQVASDTKSEIIDLYGLFANKPNMFPDKVHPSSLGATLIAKEVYKSVLKKKDNEVNFAVIPAPGSEYRPAAGWKQGKGWWYQMADIDSLCRVTKDLDILLVGNSITQGWGGGRTLTTYRPGQESAYAYFKGLNYVSAGISGDRTEHVLWRLKNGHYNANQPKLVTLAIGVNNFYHNNANEISEGIVKVVEQMEITFPNSEILFFGPLPVGLDKNSEHRKKYDAIHKSIKHLAKKPSVHYYNVVDMFSDENGNLKDTLYRGDGIHLKPEGYMVWGQFIRKKYEELIVKQ